MHKHYLAYFIHYLTFILFRTCLSPGAVLSIPAPGNCVADEEESEAVSASSRSEFSWKDGQVNAKQEILTGGPGKPGGPGSPWRKEKRQG